MANNVEVVVPDIGGFDAVEIIEVLVNVGDTVEVEDSLITLETDKATMDIPSPFAGEVKEVKVSTGDKVSQGDLIVIVAAEDAPAQTESKTEEAASPASAATPQAPAAAPQTTQTQTAEPEAVVPEKVALPDADIQCDVVVLGAGPGGYTAAFRAADLGLNTVMIERHENLGGVCLNVGCIPSKALLHTAQIINEAEAMSAHGVEFAKPTLDFAGIRDFKDKTVSRLTGGLGQLAKQRKVEVVTGEARFTSERILSVETKDGTKTIAFQNCIIAAGSRVTEIPVFPHDDPRVWDSTDALLLKEIPKRLLIVGGGIIGLEMATVYDALGSSITVVEFMDSLIPGADKDLVRPLQKFISKRYENIYLKTKVVAMDAKKDGIHVKYEGGTAPESDVFDAVLVAVGRKPNGLLIGAEKAGVDVDEMGFIATDKQMRTNVPHIFAIGDIVGQPMLAHKATHEAKVAAEVIAGHKAYFDALTIPSVAYTDPELAWTGKTEAECKAEGIAYTKGVFPWAASGRSLGLGRDEGVTKMLFDKESGRTIGAGIVGPNAGELIAEATLAIEMGSDMQDIGLTVHPHPTLSETLCFAAEMAEGTITDLMPPKKR